MHSADGSCSTLLQVITESKTQQGCWTGLKCRKVFLHIPDPLPSQQPPGPWTKIYYPKGILTLIYGPGHWLDPIGYPMESQKGLRNRASDAWESSLVQDVVHRPNHPNGVKYDYMDISYRHSTRAMTASSCRNHISCRMGNVSG